MNALKCNFVTIGEGKNDFIIIIRCYDSLFKCINKTCALVQDFFIFFFLFFLTPSLVCVNLKYFQGTDRKICAVFLLGAPNAV